MDFKDIIKRIKDYTGFSQKIIAQKIFDISDKNLSNKIRRGSVDLAALLSWASNENVDLNWLFTGEGSPISGQVSDTQTLGGKTTVDHICIVKDFKNKEEAMQISKILREIESIDERQFFRILGRLEIELEKIKTEAIPKDNNPNRRRSERRLKKDPESIPGGKDRRSGRDRRKAAGGDH
ncbi:helix-turn-helix domain-containing protein [Desulfosarcina variabilis]|uniref:helix-turn-helix domain-containing protein n=1 Tax=Desulfosarcina variabilis TaxID=2300 RepID=UPI003AFA0F11